MSLSAVITDSLALAIEQDGDSGKTTNTSKWKGRWIKTEGGQKGLLNERRRNTWWLELSNVYERYRDAIHERGFYDYSDMLVEVIAVLEQNPEILADVQERFNYVLIDEFQDTNPAQLRLAHLVTDHPSLNGRPNLMAVGDDDQSIFKFNGAELNNMLGFAKSYPSAKVIVLTKNYRSTQNVLDTARRIIEQAETRLVNSNKSLSKNLIAENPPEDNGSTKALAYSSRELQLSEIAREIKQNYKPEQTIAVLARGHDSLIKMSGILQSLDVPVRYEQQSNILDHDVINQVYLLITLLLAIQNGDKQGVNALIHQIIRHPMWNIDPVRLWNLAVENYHDEDWLGSLLASSDENLKSIGGWFTWMATHADSQPLAVTIEYLIGLRKTNSYTSPIKSYFTNTNDANSYFHGLSAIQLLRALVHEFAKHNEPSMEELARFIEINKANNKVVADESPFITGEHAVQLLSVHKAKGLEFDQVYIIDAVEDNWQPRSGSRKPPANLPLQPVGDDFDDYVRLMYVAATRAKSSIIISGYYQDHAGKDVAVSPIVQSAFEVNKISENDKQKIITILEENLHWPELSGGLEKEILKSRLETYSLSVTHLLNFLDLTRGGPEYFKERNLLRLPEIKSVSLSYGTAIHDTLEAAQKLTNKDQFDLDDIKSVFSKSLAAQQLTQSEFKRFDAQGHQTLSRLFNDFKYELPKGSIPEQNLKDIKIGAATIRGKLDRVDISGSDLKIIDYKTGGALGSFYTKDKNKALKAYKHKTQLIFYALLANEHPAYSKFARVEGQMVYVEAENQKELIKSYVATAEDIKRLKILVEVVWLKITNLELPDISGYSQDIDGILKFEDDLLK
jgi:DNA helicase-2/ATP-dependent DNA helicase PcrA